MDDVQRQRGARRLRRLEMLIDVVFALLIWDIVSTLPLPDSSGLSFGGLGEFLGGNLDLGIVLIGVVIVLNYWAQNNAHSGELKATDSKHAMLSILQRPATQARVQYRHRGLRPLRWIRQSHRLH